MAIMGVIKAINMHYCRCCRTIHWSGSIYIKHQHMKKKTYPQEYNKKLKLIGSLIREYRINSGYSQIQLAGNLNLARNTLSRVERGYDCHILNLIEITETLEIDLSELFYEEK